MQNMIFQVAIQGSDPALTHETSPALKLLCGEFRFAELSRKVEAFTDRWTSVVFETETVHILRDTLVQTCSKFRNNPSLLTQPYHATSSVEAEVFRAFVKDLDGVSPTITNENETDIGLLCEEFGHEQLSATASEFLTQHSSPGDRACRKDITPEVVPADLNQPDKVALPAARNRKRASQQLVGELLVVLLAGDLPPALPVHRRLDQPRFQMPTARRTIIIQANCVVRWHNPPLLEIVAHPIAPRVRNIF
jgi:hypothetical protein